MGTRSAEFELKLSFKTTIKNTLDDGVATASLGQSLASGKLANGVSAQQTNRGWEERDIEIADGATLDIDLYDFAGRDIGAGTGRDGVGQLLTLEEIVCLAIKKTGGDGSLEIMPSSPTGALTWIPAQTVANGGALKTNGIRVWHEDNTDALDVQDGVSHVVRFKANGGSVTFDMYIAGRNDDDESSSSSSSSSSSLSSSSQSSQSSSSSSQSSSSSSQSSSSQSSQSTSSISSRTLSSSSQSA